LADGNDKDKNEILLPGNDASHDKTKEINN
jgi:hypothetical protein